MKKLHLLLIFIGISVYAQDSNSWKEISNKTAITKSKNTERETFPNEFKLYDAPIDVLKNSLLSAPNRLKSDQSNVVIAIPNVDGNMEHFKMFEFSNFEPGLQAQFPQIRSYVGKGIEDSFATVRLSVDDNGIQATIFRSDKNSEIIEPYSSNNKIYAVYESKRTKGSLPFTCSTVDSNIAVDLNKSIVPVAKSSSGQLLIFRLALSCNGEYTTYFGGTVAGALAAMNATMTRVNGVFEKDLAIHMNIIENNASVIYTNAAADPYTTMANWNSQLQNTLSTVIGDADYDIGHMFGKTGGGGNAGCIGCVCVDGQKGSGITSPSDGIPMGDNFDIDYVAHEMGHQFGGNHSFSHNVEGSGVNVEPGSGSTIMGYAGITTRDVQQHSNDYFVYANIKQIQDNMAGKSCPVRINLTNGAPVVNAGLDYTIPKSTPFILSGTATDPNGDVLTYCWEQNDTATTQTGAASAASATKTAGPNWRSYLPVATPVRYCPPLARVVVNQSTTQGLEIVTEALSSVARTLNFVLTARDGFAGAGQTGSDAMQVTVTASAGPFLVTSPNTAVSWQTGSNQLVTWDVAGTTANGVNTANVDIYLSTDGGFTYPILLASNVPNDGSETITIPNNIGTTNRIMVKGNNHIFYDISNTNFSITAPNTDFAVAFSGITGEQNKQACTGGNVSFNVPYTAYSGFSGSTSFSLSGQPAGSTVSITPTTINSNGTVTITISNTNASPIGLSSMVLSATSGSVTKTVPLYLTLFSSNFSSLNLTSPINLAVAQATNINLTWNADSNATLYDVIVATDAAFTTIVSSGTVATTSYQVSNLLENTNYFWKVLPKNSSCQGVFSTTNTFKTGFIQCATFNSTNVPLTIATTANVTVNSTLSVASTDIISDVNVTVDISHTWVNDMTVTLISPAGTQVQLVARPCADASLLDILGTFDDSGVPVVCGNNPAISGTVQPVQSLSAFNGESMNGTWTLRVLDSFNQDGGSINNWSLNLCNVVENLSVQNNSFENFSLYPNPNNGNFNIQFKSYSNSDIKVNVFDISGRTIYNNLYKNSGLFNENIQLNKLEAGIYIVSIKDGENQITRRIVIE